MLQTPAFAHSVFTSKPLRSMLFFYHLQKVNRGSGRLVFKVTQPKASLLGFKLRVPDSKCQVFATLISIQLVYSLRG